jgi:arginase family enzyme
VGTKSKYGLSAQEMLEIMFQSGRNSKIKSVDISDYAPVIEDYRTGILISNMFYYFAMGFSLRK